MTILSTLACTIDATGCHAPAFTDIQDTLIAAYQSIYGADVYLGNDSQDGQWLGILATGFNDCNAATVAAYNAQSPATAQGNGLSSVVKINGLKRDVPTNTTVDVIIIGTVGLQISNGVVSDGTNQYDLPTIVTIPTPGQITVTATAVSQGALTAAANTITTIVNPTRGWNSVNNPAAASPGAPVETDAALRARQATSTAQPSQGVADGLQGDVEAVAGVTEVAYYENDADTPDANGLPPHSISIVVAGGDVTDIANTIAFGKSQGANTYGTTTVAVVSPAGIPYNINFFRPTQITIIVDINISVLTGFVTSVEAEIQDAVSAYINALPFGPTIYVGRLYIPANLSGISADGIFYEINSITIAISGNTPGTANIPLAFNQEAICAPTNVTISVS